MTNSPAQDPADLSDPGISPHRLQELAATHPQSWDEILAHPNVYPGLAQWIRARQAEQVSAALETQAVAEESTTDTDDDTQAQAATAVYEPIDETRAYAADDVAEQPQSDDEALPVDEPVVGDAADADSDPASDMTDPAMSHSEMSAAKPETGHGDQVAEPIHHQPEHSAEPAAQYPGAQQQPWTGGPQPQVTGQPSEPMWGWHAGAQQHANPYAHQPGQQFTYQQPGYGQQPYAAPFAQPRRRTSTAIDLNSAATWGLFVAGGAAFLGLFGFFFNPTIASFAIPASSHLAAGGWITLLLFLATVALSILQLIRPSTWMRFFFSIVGLGAAFSMIGRATALIGMFGMNSTSFSVIWLLFMSFVLLAGTMVFMAPRNQDAPPAQQASQPQQPAHPGQAAPSWQQQPVDNYRRDDSRR